MFSIIDYFCDMKLTKLISLVCIIVGGIITISAQAGKEQNTYLLVVGIVLLMFGVYSISRNIPSKSYPEDTITRIETETDED